MTDTINLPDWDEDGHLEVLTFDIGDECLAVPAVSVREILDLLPETRVPGAPPLVGSVVNFRGKIIPIADLKVAFGMAGQVDEVAARDHRIVVIETELDGDPLQVGLRTDKVHEVAILDSADACEPPVLGMRWRRNFARQLVRRPEGVIVLPDLPVIFKTLLEAA